MADPGETKMKLVALTIEGGELLLAHLLEVGRLLEIFEGLHPTNAAAHGGEVGEGATKPAVIHEILAGRFGGFADGILRLTLAADEEDLAAARNDVAEEGTSGIELLGGLDQIDDVNVVTFAENVGTHSRIPLAGLVAEVDAGFDQLGKEFVGHVRGGFLLAGNRGCLKSAISLVRSWPLRALAFRLVQGMVGSGRHLRAKIG